jgi:hypothetical protein
VLPAIAVVIVVVVVIMITVIADPPHGAIAIPDAIAIAAPGRRIVGTSEVQNKMIIMGHQISSCHVPVVRSFFIL